MPAAAFVLGLDSSGRNHVTKSTGMSILKAVVLKACPLHTAALGQSTGVATRLQQLHASRTIFFGRKTRANFGCVESTTVFSVTADGAAVESKKPTKKTDGAKPDTSKSEGVTPRSEDYSRWYLDIVREAELADYGPVRGTMVIRPYGYAIWENIQKYLDAKFKETGHVNAYFPQFIPYSFIEKEKEHVEGFSPELALVTVAGGKDLEEPLVVRPTSETIINHMYAQWIKSYRDLPVLINQWANVVRWEMRTRPFLRTCEFLWQEGHTAHATPEEAEEEALKMLDVYRQFAEEQAAIPVITGQKSRIEQFAGAVRSYTIEAMMGDRRALQAGTSHNLGQNFAKAFGTQYLDETGKLQHVWQTSWGVSTRMVGAIIMVHGDDQGLRLPPNIAPIQTVIVPIWKKDSEKDQVMAAAETLLKKLADAGIRVKMDATPLKTPGWKFNFWEMKGVPVRIEVGPRDVEKNCFVTARRDRPGKEGKTFGVPMEDAVSAVSALLEDIQANLYAQALVHREENTHPISSYDDLKAVVEKGGFAQGWWAGSDADEKMVKEETGATIRCFPLKQPAADGEQRCFLTGNPATRCAVFARAY